MGLTSEGLGLGSHLTLVIYPVWPLGSAASFQKGRTRLCLVFQDLVFPRGSGTFPTERTENLRFLLVLQLLNPGRMSQSLSALLNTSRAAVPGTHREAHVACGCVCSSGLAQLLKSVIGNPASSLTVHCELDGNLSKPRHLDSPVLYSHGHSGKLPNQSSADPGRQALPWGDSRKPKGKRAWPG